MLVSRRYRTVLLLFGLALCLLILDSVHRFSNIFDLIFYFTSTEIKVLPLSLQCNLGRLGNQMCTYATLYGVSSLNRRHFISLSCNVNHLRDIFIGPSKVPSKPSYAYLRWHPWNLLPYLKPADSAIPLNSNFLNGYLYPCSFTFFDHVRDDIRRQFQFHGHFNQYAQTVLQRANYKHLPNVTFVGVHVRRGDYKHWLEVFEGVPVNEEYFRRAFQYFRDKYKNVIFVAISDDRQWCVNRLSRQFGVHVPDEAPSPAHDLATLANCNHTIMTYGTFGFWGSYLAGGEVLYFDKFLKPNTSFTLENFIFEKMYLPSWKGIVTVNVTDLFQANATREDKRVARLR